MDRYEAARALGVADADLLAVAETADGVQVEMTGGGRRLIRDDGVYALDDRVRLLVRGTLGSGRHGHHGTA